MPRVGGRAAGLQPSELPGRLLPGHSRCDGRSTSSRGRPCSSRSWPASCGRSGAFPIQREGIGASGMKETLRRLRGRRDRHALPRGDAQRRRPARLRSSRGSRSWSPGPVCRSSPSAWPARSRSGRDRGWFRSLIRSGSITGRPIFPEELAGMETEAITALIRDRLEECRQEARRGLRRDATRTESASAGMAGCRFVQQSGLQHEQSERRGRRC